MIDFLTLYIYQQTYIHMGNSTGREPRFPPDPLGIEELTVKLDDLKNKYKKIQKNLLYIRDRGKFESTKQEIANDISGWGEIIRDIRKTNQLPVNDRGELLSKSDLINLMNQSLTKAGTLKSETSAKAVNEEISRKREEGEGTYVITRWVYKEFPNVPEYRIKDEGVKQQMINDGLEIQSYLNNGSY